MMTEKTTSDASSEKQTGLHLRGNIWWITWYSSRPTAGSHRPEIIGREFGT
jgi:hypothetical protein